MEGFHFIFYSFFKHTQTQYEVDGAAENRFKKELKEVKFIKFKLFYIVNKHSLAYTFSTLKMS